MRQFFPFYEKISPIYWVNNRKYNPLKVLEEEFFVDSVCIKYESHLVGI